MRDMKQMKHQVLTLAALLLASANMWAGQVVIKTSPANSGSVTASEAAAGQTCTLTVTPAEGYYLTAENLSAVTTLNSGALQTPRRADGIDVASQPVAITATDASADPSGVTTYTFTMPEDANIDVEVTAEFQTVIAISPTVSLEGWTYGTSPNTPVVSGNTGQGAETFTYRAAGSETFTEDVPTVAGTHTVKLSIAAAGKYAAGEATSEFTIGKADITPTVTMSGWTFGGTPSTPEVTGNTGQGAESFTYRSAGSETFTEDVPTAAGTHTVKVTIAATDNYNGGEATSEFTIGKADISAVSIADIADQTYTGEAIEPTVTVKLGDVTIGAEQYSVAYTDNVNVGVATVTLTFTSGNFTTSEPALTKTATFQIAAATAIITAQAEQTATYDTKAHEIVATVEKGTIAVAYYATADDRTEGSNVLEVLPVNAGTYFARISQTDANYTSEPVDVTLTILPAEITAVTLAETTLRYTGEEQTVQVDAVVAGTLTLTADDYDVTGLTATDKGTHTVTVTGKGNFTGTATATFTIVNRLLEGVTFAADWASYFNADEDIDLPEGIAAYVVTGVGETSATLTQLSLIPAATPVLLHQGDEATTENTLADGNMMRHADEAVEVAAVGGTVYGLYEGALMRVATGTIPAGRNYLLVAATASPAPRLGLKTDSDIVTGISTAVQTAADGDRWYTLDGQPLQQKPARRGIYIKNGQKVYIYNK